MPSVFKRADSKPTGPDKIVRSRWATEFYIEGTKITALLGLFAPGNEKQARRRAKDLEIACNRGELTDPINEWLGWKAAKRIEGLICKTTKKNATGMRTWEDASAAYLKVCEARDIVDAPSGKALHANMTFRQRVLAVRSFIQWAREAPTPFPPDRFETPVIEWMNWRRTRLTKKGDRVKWVTIRGQLAYVRLFGQWLTDKDLCPEPNWRQVKTAMPPDREKYRIVLPSWQQDLAVIRFFRERRKGIGVRQDRHPGIWVFWLLVRGLGCRPTEALGLTWETVELDACTVTFLATKERKRFGDRRVPIIYQWVLDGLREAWEARGKPARGAVCLGAKGAPWLRHESLDRCINALLDERARDEHCLVRILPKQAQKLAISQMVLHGFPAHAVARWTGHTLSVQEKHYCEHDLYMQAHPDYSEFGNLTTFGQLVFERLKSGVEGRL